MPEDQSEGRDLLDLLKDKMRLVVFGVLLVLAVGAIEVGLDKAFGRK